MEDSFRPCEKRIKAVNNSEVNVEVNIIDDHFESKLFPFLPDLNENQKGPANNFKLFSRRPNAGVKGRVS